MAGLRSICVDPALVVGSNFRWEMVLGKDFDAAKEFARSFPGLRTAMYHLVLRLEAVDSLSVIRRVHTLTV